MEQDNKFENSLIGIFLIMNVGAHLVLATFTIAVYLLASFVNLEIITPDFQSVTWAGVRSFEAGIAGFSMVFSVLAKFAI